MTYHKSLWTLWFTQFNQAKPVGMYSLLTKSGAGFLLKVHLSDSNTRSSSSRETLLGVSTSSQRKRGVHRHRRIGVESVQAPAQGCTADRLLRIHPARDTAVTFKIECGTCNGFASGNGLAGDNCSIELTDGTNGSQCVTFAVVNSIVQLQQCVPRMLRFSALLKNDNYDEDSFAQ
ncbi:hypothetical protein C8R44DRAFT_731010 [Mycena epipterygia]|nr:hypothetical protein C8R44DRAFT_731010 [Mycena epipterygia]